MKQLPPLTCLLLICLLFACKRERLSPDNPDASQRLLPTGGPAVFAGVVKPGMILQEFNPALEVPLQWDSQNLYGEGSLPLDLDNDGLSDMDLQLTIMNTDSLHLLNGELPDPFPSCKIALSANWLLPVTRHAYATGHGQTGTAFYVQVFEAEEQITSYGNEWSFRYSKLWQESFSNYAPPIGPWYTHREVGYLGFVKRGQRLWDKRFGWIELDNTDVSHPKVLRIGMEP